MLAVVSPLSGSLRYMGIDLPDAVADFLFDDHIDARYIRTQGPRELWKYSKSTPASWRRTPAWPEVHKLRYVLSDALRASKGKSLKAKKWT